jgi:hypothetical protein
VMAKAAKTTRAMLNLRVIVISPRSVPVRKAVVADIAWRFQLTDPTAALIGDRGFVGGDRP